MKKILFVVLLLLINAISLAYSEKLEPGDDFYIETLDYRNGNAIIYGNGWIGNGDWSSSTLVIKNLPYERYKKFQEKDGVLVFKCGISIQVADDNSGTLYIDAENVRSYRSETHREADTQVYEKGCFNK